MGMDCWIRAKTKVREYRKPTSMVNGLFNIVPDDNGMIELCYLRNPDDQDILLSYYVRNVSKEDGGIQTYLINKEKIKDLLQEAKMILNTHQFDECGIDITERDSGYYGYTYFSNEKWKTLIRALEEATQILKEDEEAEIYYIVY